MHKLVHDVNAYVEQDNKYLADSVLVTLTENKDEEGEVLENVVVEVYPADVYGNKVADANPIAVRDFGTDLKGAIEYYNSVEHQLSMGDTIRHV